MEALKGSLLLWQRRALQFPILRKGTQVIHYIYRKVQNVQLWDYAETVELNARRQWAVGAIRRDRLFFYFYYYSYIVWRRAREPILPVSGYSY
jgi:hypothetical protein